MLEINGTDIVLTRGDSAYISIPVLNANGSDHPVVSGESVALQVRKAPVTGSGTDPDVVISGDISINSSGVPVWHISPADSTVEARSYTWDVQIALSNGDVCTYNYGTITILPENTIVTLPPTPVTPSNLVGEALVGEAKVG